MTRNRTRRPYTGLRRLRNPLIAFKRQTTPADGFEVAQIPTSDAAKAVSHPLRVAILEALGGEHLSPRAVAWELSEPLANVSYHFKVLRRLGAIELTGTRPRRGATEHFYKAKWRVRVEAEPVEPVEQFARGTR